MRKTITPPKKNTNINLNWWFFRGDAVDKSTAVRLQEAALHHSHMAECFDYGAKRVYAVSFPNEKNQISIFL